MANFPNGIGSVTLAQMQAGEAVTAAGTVYDQWTFGGPNNPAPLPANTVANFVAGAARPDGTRPHHINFQGSFVVGQAYVWGYRVSGATFTSAEIDLAQAAGTTGAVIFTLNTTTNGSQPQQQTAQIQKAGGAVVQSSNVPLALGSGVTTVTASNELLVNGPVTYTQTQWSK